MVTGRVSSLKTDQTVVEGEADGSQGGPGLGFSANVTLVGLAWAACAGQGGRDCPLVSCVWGPSGGPGNTVLGLE